MCKSAFYKLFATSALMLFVSLVPLASFSQTAFTCSDGVSYLITGNPSVLKSVNLRTGATTDLLSATALGNRNLTGLGYNPIDNLLYASISGTNRIVRIGSDGTVQEITVPGLTADTYEAGDIAPNGTMYLYSSGGTVMKKIDLTAGTIVATDVTASPLTGFAVDDFSVDPTGSRVYGISTANGDLITFPLDGTTTSAASTDVGLVPNSSGSAFMEAGGNLFVVANSSSNVFEVVAPNSAHAESGVRITPNLATPVSNTDGARCATSRATPQQAVFTCDPNVAFSANSVQEVGEGCEETRDANTRIIKYNPETGVVESTSNPIIQSFGSATQWRTAINNLGYNATDNYLWGFRIGTGQLVRIGSDNTVDYYQIPGLTLGCPASGVGADNTYFISGDVSPSGVMYLFNGARGTELIRVNVNPGSATYLQKLSNIPLSLSPGAGTAGNMSDMAFNPKDGMLYSVTPANEVIRINPTTGAVTNLGVVTGVSLPTNNYGSIYFDKDGDLHADENDASRILHIPDVANGSVAGTETTSGLDVGGANDGASCTQTPLPVTLSEFKAAKGEGMQVLLSWSTTEESNSDRFEIERRISKGKWFVLGTVPASGESQGIIRYQYVDQQPLKGENIYRLRMVDLDATFSYSSLRSVTFETGPELRVYPNPVKNQLRLDLPGGERTSSVRIYDQGGRQVRHFPYRTGETIDTRSITPGLYYLTVEQKGGISQKAKVVITK